jgi:hypothetical protein
LATSKVNEISPKASATTRKVKTSSECSIKESLFQHHEKAYFNPPKQENLLHRGCEARKSSLKTSTAFSLLPQNVHKTSPPKLCLAAKTNLISYHGNIPPTVIHFSDFSLSECFANVMSKWNFENVAT